MAKVAKLERYRGGFAFAITGAAADRKETIDRLTARIPKPMCYWDNIREVWFVSHAYLDVLVKLFTNFEEAVEELEAKDSQMDLFKGGG